MKLSKKAFDFAQKLLKLHSTDEKIQSLEPKKETNYFFLIPFEFF